MRRGLIGVVRGEGLRRGQCWGGKDKPQWGDPIKAQGEQPCKGDQTLGSPR